MNNHHLQLLRQTAEGNQTSFQKLYDFFSSKVYNTALLHLQNKEEAEEVTQDVFVEVYRAAKDFKGDAQVSTWIFRIAVNKCVDRLRYHKRKKRFAFVLSFFSGEGAVRFDTPSFDHPGLSLENKEKGRLLMQAIGQLPEAQKNVIIMALIEDRPRQEIADIMNQSLKATESTLQRAKANLRHILEEYYRAEKE